MTPEQFEKLEIKTRVIAYTGGHEHCAEVIDIDRDRKFMRLRFKLADGSMAEGDRSFSAVYLCDQHKSIGPTTVHMTEEGLRKLSDTTGQACWEWDGMAICESCRVRLQVPKNACLLVGFNQPPVDCVECANVEVAR